MVTYPSDWDTTTLGALGEVKMCKRIFQSQTHSSGQIPFYKIGTFGGTPDAYISRKLYEDYKKLYSFPVKGDVLISAAGTIGRTVVYDGKDAYFQDSNIVWLSVNPEEVDRQFLKYFYQSFPWMNLEGTTISRLYNGIIRGTHIHLPSLPEQKAIAKALEAFDTHIANLAELIEKKKAIRDGALEDLVSGRTRLAGFTQKWIDTTINAVTQDVITGGTPSTSHPEYWGGTIPWLASTEIHQKMLSRETTQITELGLASSSAKIAPAESVLIALAGQGKTRGTAAYLLRPMALNQSLAALVSSEKMIPKFLYYLMDRLYLPLRELSSGDGGRGGLNKKLLKGLSIYIPLDIEEQKAIADVLTAMDDEITALEDERNKMIQIREGAMDDLLTGRVRLPI